ncbi:MAG: sulfate adenylyltransferase [Candidatus Hodarchaeales archaeon]|jgi:sulfate adenylyltransferase
MNNSQRSSNELITPHGGKLVNCTVNGDEREQLIIKSQNLPQLQIEKRTLADLECIGTGVYSPLTGFLGENDYKHVVQEMRLSNGLIWPIPVTLQVEEEFANSLKPESEIALWFKDKLLAIMKIIDIYKPDIKEEARKVYQTKDENHPGIKAIYQSGPIYIGGPIQIVNEIPHDDFRQYRLTPAQLREEFKRKGWRTIVAFQTRNPIHRAHEYLMKVALESVDGLLINPLMGATKSDDVPADVRMKTYEAMMKHYFPNNRVTLCVFPAAMRYAGPREAIMHSIARQNYGCSHFIVGRDHAGVGDYYGTYDAQRIFEQFSPKELPIQIFKFDHAYYSKATQQMASDKTAPEGGEKVFLSGTKVREMLKNGELLPSEFTRPEVAQILREAYREMSKPKQKGVTIWFTGLSSSGKTTLSRQLEHYLKNQNRKVEILDGDIIRQNLTKGLGFSKKGRDENIRRIGFVAHLLTRNDAIVLVAAISPYRAIRREVRQRIGDFVEVYAEAPLDVCEGRDVKGLYKKARSGEIKGFTGIDDPYEIPEAPEVVCYTDKETIEESTQKIINKLEELGFI